MAIETITQSITSFFHYVMENTDSKQKAALGVGAFALAYFLWSKARGWNEHCVLSKMIGNKDVRLICKSYWGGKSELFWDVRNRITRLTKRTYAVEDFSDCPETYLRVVNDNQIQAFREQYIKTLWSYRGIPSNKCSEWLKQIPVADRIGYFEDHEIDLDSAGIPRLHKIIARSQFDNSIVLDRDNWAVTILCNSKSRLVEHLIGHAVIAIEGIKNGIKHTMYATANGSDSTLSGSTVTFIQDDKNKQYTESVIVKKSETWERASHLVIRMLDEIKREADLSERKINPFLFNPFGGRTIFSWISERFSSKKHHNCYTWIVEKLEIAEIYAQSNNILNSFVAIPAREIDGCVII